MLVLSKEDKKEGEEMVSNEEMIFDGLMMFKGQKKGFTLIMAIEENVRTVVKEDMTIIIDMTEGREAIKETAMKEAIDKITSEIKRGKEVTGEIGWRETIELKGIRMEKEKGQATKTNPKTIDRFVD